MEKNLTDRLETALAELRKLDKSNIPKEQIRAVRSNIISVLNDMYDIRSTARQDEPYLRIVQ